MFRLIVVLVIISFIVFLLPSREADFVETDVSDYGSIELADKDVNEDVNMVEYDEAEVPRSRHNIDSTIPTTSSDTEQEQSIKTKNSLDEKEEELKKEEDNILKEIAGSYEGLNTENKKIKIEKFKKPKLSIRPDKRYSSSENTDSVVKKPSDAINKNGIERQDSSGLSQSLKKGRVIEPRSVLRTGPGFDHSRITILDEGTEISLDYSTDEWYRIVTEDGIRAWILKENIKELQ